ncbi:uncharacterized protein TRAVEDRAFT_168464 [Trametes versicolor FP-101664 SS1]|uniref:uncharacterized protein n=1 Tax=Trametes versicolor (strain FP-101664) TaxID=717944 RepID=UPI0004623DFD|nr:uncharacterized protein TRAVEDRAFT_168464 [Trametes versicolor FP-101664 SS1]EIW58731.1 hypothetical protein TRAVEDRAFT_168464 [Trametes versicolor FP-101664 SS1]
MRRSTDALSVLSTDDLADYDVISDGPRSMESSIADLGQAPKYAGGEPAPLPSAREKFDTVGLTAEDIQTHVQRSLGAQPDARTWRVYVDGVFGPLTPRDVLQLRQAKLSFPSVQLVVGVFADDICEEHGVPSEVPHADRCEVLRHCRWVDEVVPDAPWTLHERFLRARHVDYVAIDEGTSIDPDVDRERLKGYDLVKSLRKAIPTRRTNVSTPMPKSFDPFKKEKEGKVEQEPPSRKSTVKGVPIELAQESEVDAGRRADILEALETPFEEPPEPTPFEEPKIDEFGTGVGV